MFNVLHPNGMLTPSPSSPLFSKILQVMELLEEKVGSGRFLEALTGVNMEISRKRVERKRQRAVEKATDPVAAAERRKERTEAGKVNRTKQILFQVHYDMEERSSVEVSPAGRGCPGFVLLSHRTDAYRIVSYSIVSYRISTMPPPEANCRQRSQGQL